MSLAPVFVRWILVGVSLFWLAPALQAQTWQDRFELSVLAGGMITDDAVRLDGHAELISLARSFGPEHVVEFELGQDRLDFGVDYGLTHDFAAVNYMQVNREPLWDPYILIGAGISRFEAPAAIRTGEDPFLQVGLGGQWDLLESGKLKLRADLRFRYDFNDTGQPGQDGFGDAIFTVGLSLPFGSG